MFKLKEHQTTPMVEITAGLTTFCAMVYVVAANPAILASAGAPAPALFTTTILAAIVGCLIMAVVANLPFAAAPGMGINAVFSFVVVQSMGYSWEQAIAAVIIASVLFILLSLSPLRTKIIQDIPPSLQLAVCGGVGILIASIGLLNTGVILVNNGTPTMGYLHNPPVLLFFIGLFLTALMLALKIRYAVLAGILISTLIGVPLGVTQLPDINNLFSLPPSPSPLIFQADFSLATTLEFYSIVSVFLFMAIFDGLAGFLGIFSVMGPRDAAKYRHKLGRAFVGDSLSMLASGFLGMSPNTVYGESGTGVAVGGRTGLTALVCGVCFIFTLFCAPIFLAIPMAAVAPALMVVGWFMLTPLGEVDFKDPTESFPAIIVMILIGLSWKITDSLAIAWLVYICMKLVSGRVKELNATVWLVGLVFALKLGWDLTRGFMG